MEERKILGAGASMPSDGQLSLANLLWRRILPSSGLSRFLHPRENTPCTLFSFVASAPHCFSALL